MYIVVTDFIARATFLFQGQTRPQYVIGIVVIWSESQMQDHTKYRSL